MTQINKINVMHLDFCTKIGGAERMLLAFLSKADRTRFNMMACCPSQAENFCREVVKFNTKLITLDIDITRLNTLNILNPSLILRLAKIFRQENIHVLHSYLFAANMRGRISGWLVRVPVIISGQRSTDDWRRKWHSIFDKTTSFMVDKYISNSTAGSNALIKRDKISYSKIITIPNGIDTERFKIVSKDKIQSLRRDMNIRENEFVVGTVCRLQPVKDLHTFLLAASIVRKKIPNAKFIIVGDGSLREELEIFAYEHNLSENVVFTGFQNDITLFIPTFDVFVLTSLWEGMPVSILEAMASGKPVVATNVGSVAELVEPNKSGILISPKDFVMLANSIIQLLEDDKTRINMGSNARKRAERYFALDKMVDDIQNVYVEEVEKVMYKIK